MYEWVARCYDTENSKENTYLKVVKDECGFGFTFT